jgi:hypothetical protein
VKAVCERCEETFSDLLPTTLGLLCESCAWAVIERDQEGELGLLEQATTPESQAQVQQGQL